MRISVDTAALANILSSSEASVIADFATALKELKSGDSAQEEELIRVVEGSPPAERHSAMLLLGMRHATIRDRER